MMEFTLEDIAFLRSAPGERVLERLRAENMADAHLLALATALRKEYGARQASVALEMARLRIKAVDKFGADAARLFFTPDALEQASDPHVRRHRFRFSVFNHRYDACCGIGADTLELAAGYSAAHGFDLDPVRIDIARYNAAQLDRKASFSISDVRTEPSLLSLKAGDYVFFDPGRRNAAGKRLFDVEAYQPPLSTIRRWLERADPDQDAFMVDVKLSPGVDLAQIAPYHGWLRFYSVEGDLKEAVLGVQPAFTYGDLHHAPPPEAFLYRNGAWHHWAKPAAVPTPPVDVPRAWLCEPDPALIRIGAVQQIANHCGGALLDETIAYFTCDALPADPALRVWVRAWRVRDWMPFSVKRLRAYCREHAVGGVTVKKRGTAVTPEVIIPQLKLKGDMRATLVLTRCQGDQIALICDEMPTDLATQNAP